MNADWLSLRHVPTPNSVGKESETSPEPRTGWGEDQGALPEQGLKDKIESFVSPEKEE